MWIDLRLIASKGEHWNLNLGVLTPGILRDHSRNSSAGAPWWPSGSMKRQDGMRAWVWVRVFLCGGPRFEMLRGVVSRQDSRTLFLLGCCLAWVTRRRRDGWSCLVIRSWRRAFRYGGTQWCEESQVWNQEKRASVGTQWIFKGKLLLGVAPAHTCLENRSALST